jgi:hypothetical protein
MPSDGWPEVMNSTGGALGGVSFHSEHMDVRRARQLRIVLVRKIPGILLREIV